MVNKAKEVAINPRNQASASQWRDANDRLLDSVRGVGDAITGLPSRRPTPQQQPQQQQYQQQQQQQVPQPQRYSADMNNHGNNVQQQPAPINSHYQQQQQQRQNTPQWPSGTNVSAANYC
jgi:hypothetical protein